MEVVNNAGNRAVRLVFGPDGHVRVTDGAKSLDAGVYKAKTWYNLAIKVDAANGRYDATLDGKPIARQASFMEPASDVNRLCFRNRE